MAQKALVLSKLHVFGLQSHQRNKNYPTFTQVQMLIGLVKNKIYYKINLIITE